MNELEIWRHFDPVFEDTFGRVAAVDHRPKLAHYTSLQVLEEILKSNEIWLSNPLYMNDYREFSYGVQVGLELIRQSDVLARVFRSDEFRQQFYQQVEENNLKFLSHDLPDTYVFCLSEHEQNDFDGLLSMWRGYGGNGKGAALVFDTANVNFLDQSQLMLEKVAYVSDSELRNRLHSKINEFAELLGQLDLIKIESIGTVVRRLFDGLTYFSLVHKHEGFREEKEWRLIYLRGRDYEKSMDCFFDYLNGPRGVEPKMKVPIMPLDGVIGEGVTLNSIIDSILVGPVGSNYVSLRSISRMVGNHIPALADRVRSSQIPYRDF